MAETHCLDELGELLLSGGVDVIDLTAPLGPETPLLELPQGLGANTPTIEIHKISEYDEKGGQWAWNWLKLGEHSGTHFDAPHHWVTGKNFVDGYTDTMPVRNCVAPVNVIDCAGNAAEDPEFLLTAADVKMWEARHGEIRPGEWVLMRTDWDKRNHSRECFFNADQNGPRYPGPSSDCIDYIIDRGAIGLGVQPISTDASSSSRLPVPFPAHVKLHAANRYGLASLANLDQVPAKGAILIAAPLKIVKGTGSPVRALALVPKRLSVAT
jgi:isatin hydrolase